MPRDLGCPEWIRQSLQCGPRPDASIVHLFSFLATRTTQNVLVRTRPLIALFGDIHANLQAFEACLIDAREQGATRFVFLGDFVGYGGDPDAVLSIVQDMCAKGAVAVKGNHDDMAGDFDRDMTPYAAQAANWTRRQLTASQRAFLDALPLAITEEDRLYVHADATAPQKWRYVTNSECARDSLQASEARIIFSGHVHMPAIYGLSADGSIARFIPQHDCPVPLLLTRRWQVVLPSVGQPRDENPLSGYALFDPATREITFRRLPYDIDAAAARICEVGLPQGLANRLHKGR
jgi:diadenosine tetraphosphatase ApaH/serine/threonine PP2A family protein phosphatase